KIWAQTEGAARALEAFHMTPNLRPLKKDVVGDVGSVLSVLMGALGLVLVLVRAQSRRQEFAVRAALGAGWRRIARELLVESLSLGIAGGAFGLMLAYTGLRVLATLGPATLPRLEEI